jgi:hypothetical protein
MPLEVNSDLRFNIFAAATCEKCPMFGDPAQNMGMFPNVVVFDALCNSLNEEAKNRAICSGGPIRFADLSRVSTVSLTVTIFFPSPLRCQMLHSMQPVVGHLTITALGSDIKPCWSMFLYIISHHYYLYHGLSRHRSQLETLYGRHI